MLSSLLFLINMLLIANCDPPKTLKQVNLLYRHGDRSPVFVYPKDKHQISNTWSDGLGWLSNIGKKQQFELGKFIGQRYKGFINISRYNHEEIVIEASAVPRCLMSAYSNLAGLFPPQQDQVWLKDFPWQPIPVQTRPVIEDNKLAMSEPCPRYDQLLKEQFQSPYIKRQDIENKDFYDIIENKTGIKKESVKDIWGLADNLFCERAHNLTWNDWANEPGVWERIDVLHTESFDLLFNGTEQIKLQGGVLLKEIIANMHTAKKQTLVSPKLHMYSAHDTTVIALLRAMNANTRHQPPYTALVMVELHEIDGADVVKFFYRNDTTVEPHELSPEGCGSPCYLDKFVTATKDHVPVDWAAECVAHPPEESLTTASWIALSVGGCICILIAVVFGVSIVRHCKGNTIAYTHI